jgi:hypothetical protein
VVRQGFQDSIDCVDEILAKEPKAKALRLKLRGQFMTEWAWAARGSGFANTVTEDSWRKFGERLQLARDAYEEAWGLDPTDPSTGQRMIMVVKGLQGNRAEIKRWFDRVMSADPDDYDTCVTLLDYLDPKWHGSPEEVLAFGRACRDSKNPRIRVRLLVAEAHVRTHWLRGTGATSFYMSNPAIWKEISAVHDEYFARFPDDWKQHGHYSMYAFLCGQIGVARDQFRLAGSVLEPTMLFRAEYMKQVRDRVLLEDRTKKKTAPK